MKFILLIQESFTVEQWDFQNKVKVDWYELLCFVSSTEQLVSQHVWFCTMWQDHAKGLLYIHVYV